MNISKIPVKNVEKVYIGKDKVCRCGCAGKYYRDAKNIQRLLNRAERGIANGQYTIDNECNTHINVSSDTDRAITIYFRG